MAHRAGSSEDPPHRESLIALGRLVLPVWLIAAACVAGPDRDWVRFSNRQEGESTQVIGENLHPWAPFHAACALQSNGCYDWAPPQSCPTFQTCSGGQCVSSCTDQCEAGETQCSGANVQSCLLQANG